MFVVVARIPGHEIEEIRTKDHHTARLVADGLVRIIMSASTAFRPLTASMWEEGEIGKWPTESVDVTYWWDECDYSYGGVTIFMDVKR